MADNSEIVTGVFPLPLVNFGRKVIIPQSGLVVPQEGIRTRLSLDWTDSQSLAKAWAFDKGDNAQSVPPFLTFRLSFPVWIRRIRSRSCHVAVIGGCEGEAVLLSNWVRKRRHELESLLRVNVESLSWLSSDFAPIGQFVEGSLRANPVNVSVWVLVATGVRFASCHTTKLLINAVAQSGRELVLFSLDEGSQNVNRCETMRESTQNSASSVMQIARKASTFRTHYGGLYRGQIPRDLLRDDDSNAASNEHMVSATLPAAAG